jgi:hypothetical protein
MRINFKAPYHFEEKEYDGIDLDLESLRGSDLERAQEIITASRKRTGSAIPELSKVYCAQVAALAAKVSAEMISGLPVREYVKVTMEVQNFLLDGVSEAENTR